MFVRYSMVAGFVASLLAVSIATAAGPQRDLDVPGADGKTYGMTSCKWETAPRVQERAKAGGMTYVITNGTALCLPEGLGKPYLTDSDYTRITNVRCDGASREAITKVRTCLRQHQGRLQARDGYFTFVHPNPASQPSAAQQRTIRASGAK